MDIATITKLIDAGFTAQEVRTFAGAGTGANANTGAATPAGAAPDPVTPPQAGSAGTSISVGTGANIGIDTGAQTGAGTNDAAELARALKQMQENLQNQQMHQQLNQSSADDQTMRDLLGAIRNLNTTIQAGAILNSNMPPIQSDADIAAGGLANILNPFADKK